MVSENLQHHMMDAVEGESIPWLRVLLFKKKKDPNILFPSFYFFFLFKLNKLNCSEQLLAHS